jgi:hypothetical protein
VRVVNVCTTPQSFWTSGYSLRMHCKSSDPCVSVVPPERPGLYQSYEITLAPGAAFESTVPMKTTATRDVSFRMGMAPRSVGPHLLPRCKRTFWSPQVTIKVRR